MTTQKTAPIDRLDPLGAVELMERLEKAGCGRFSTGMVSDLIRVLGRLQNNERQWIPYVDLFEGINHHRVDRLNKINLRKVYWDARNLPLPTQGYFKEARLAPTGRKLLKNVFVS